MPNRERRWEETRRAKASKCVATIKVTPSDSNS